MGMTKEQEAHWIKKIQERNILKVISRELSTFGPLWLYLLLEKHEWKH